MKTIIGLFGPGNVGKSETIKLVYRKLTEIFPNLKFHNDFNQIIPNEGDICVVIVINGKIIGIESQGDPKSRLFESIPTFVELHCDIILCATRTRGGTVDLIEDLGNIYKIQWHYKSGNQDNSLRRSNDEQMASKIVDIITDLVN